MSRSPIDLTGDIQHVHDPVLIRARKRWYLFSTGDGIPVRVSDDLRHWKTQGTVFPELPNWARDAVPGVKNPWAPDVLERDSQFHLYYSLSTFGSQHSAIGLAVSSDLESGRWEDRGLVFQSRRGDPWNAIDPNVFLAPDGRLWMAFGSFWQGLYLLELDKATGKPNPGSRPTRIAARPNGGTAIEAPFLLHRNGWIYLFVSVDYCCRRDRSTYKTLVGRAKSVRGPFLDQLGKPLLEGGGTLLCAGGPRWRGPGHPGLASQGNRWWIAMHAYDSENDGVPTLRIAELQWKNDWPEVPNLLDPVRGSPDLAGTWEHKVGDGAATMVIFHPDGAIDNSVPGPGNRRESGGRWEASGSGWVLHWSNPGDRSKPFRDEIRIGKTGKTYYGKTADGKPVEGTRIR